MPGTVVTDLAFFTGATGGSTSNCDQITDWVTAPTLDLITFIQGIGALSAKVSKATFTSVFSLVAAVNLTGKVIYVWAMCSGKMDTKANGGFRVRVENAAGQFGEWYLAGSDTWAGGWTPWTVHTSTAFAPGATIPDVTAITKVGIVFKTIGSATAVNCWWDAMRYGTYIGVKGGTDVSPATLQDIIDQENLVDNKWGVLSEYEGVFITQGKLIIGSTTAQDNTYFKDTSERILIFPDKPFPSDFYEIKLQGNTAAPPTYFTKVFFGEKVGGTGVRGVTIRAASSAKPFKVTASDTNITEYGFYGCSFYQASDITLQAYSTVKEFLGCSVSKSAEMLPDTGIVKDCTIMSATNRGIRMASASHHITDSKFISCPHSVHCPVSIAVPFTSLQFFGTNGTDKWDIEHSVAGTLTVNWTGYQPQYVDETGGGNTVFYNYVDLTIYVKDEAQQNISGASVRVSKLDNNTVVYMNEVTDVNGIAYESINNPGTVNLRIRARKSTTGTRYIPMETTGQMTATGFALTVTLYKDGNIP